MEDSSLIVQVILNNIKLKNLLPLCANLFVNKEIRRIYKIRIVYYFQLKVFKTSKYYSIDILKYVFSDIYGQSIIYHFHKGYKRGVLAKAGISYNEEICKIIPRSMIDSLWNYSLHNINVKYPSHISSLLELRKIMKCLHLMGEPLMEVVIYYVFNLNIDHSIIVDYIRLVNFDTVSIINTSLENILNKTSHYNVSKILRIVRLYNIYIDEEIKDYIRMHHDHYLDMVSLYGNKYTKFSNYLNEYNILINILNN